MASSVVPCSSCGARNRVRANPTAVPKCARCGAKLPWTVDAGDADFDEEVRAAVPVEVDLWAPWCGPCRMVSPLLERFAVDNAGRVKLVKVNVDEAPATAQRYRAMSIPTMVVLRDGEEVDRIVGADPRIADRLAPHLEPAPG